MDRIGVEVGFLIFVSFYFWGSGGLVPGRRLLAFEKLAVFSLTLQRSAQISAAAEDHLGGPMLALPTPGGEGDLQISQGEHRFATPRCGLPRTGLGASGLFDIFVGVAWHEGKNMKKQIKMNDIARLGQLRGDIVSSLNLMRDFWHCLRFSCKGASFASFAPYGVSLICGEACPPSSLTSLQDPEAA